MALTISEAAQAKGITRNGVWLAIRRNEFTCRRTSGGMWLIEEDEKWENYTPRNYPEKQAKKRTRKEA